MRQKLLDTHQHIATAILACFPLDYIRRMSSKTQNFSLDICVTTCATYQMVRDIHGRLPSHLERALIQEPVILMDTLGQIRPIPIQCFSSWGSLESYLEYEYRDSVVHNEILGKKYAFLNGWGDDGLECWQRDPIERWHPWELSFRPGQKVMMSAFFENVPLAYSCPSCCEYSRGLTEDRKW